MEIEKNSAFEFDYKFEKIDDKIFLIIDAQNFEPEISNDMLALIADREGFKLCEITNLELNGGKYADECFACSVWSDEKKMRGRPDKNGKGFENAFSSLNKIKVSNISKIDKHFCVFAEKSQNLEFEADKNLKNIAREAFAYSAFSKLTAPGLFIPEITIKQALYPHGCIMNQSSSEPNK